MKKRFEEWRTLTANTKPVDASTVLAPIRVLDLPGFQNLEDKLLIYTSRRGEVPPELERLINDLSKQTFGVAKDETLFENSDESDELPPGRKNRKRQTIYTIRTRINSRRTK